MQLTNKLETTGHCERSLRGAMTHVVTLGGATTSVERAPQAPQLLTFGLGQGGTHRAGLPK